jgi:hypothetical protein
LAIAVSSIAAALVVPAGAVAAAPVLLSVGQTSGHLTATWSLPPGVQAEVAEAAQNPSTSSDGYFFFENVLAAGAFDTLADTQTTWVFNFQSKPGTYYVHIAGLDVACFYSGACPVREFSQMLTVTVPAAGPPPPPPPTTPIPLADCTVPNLKGLTLAVARMRIVQKHCSVGVVTRAYSTSARAGRVIRQTPPTGSALARGAEVDLLVSRGRRR